MTVLPMPTPASPPDPHAVRLLLQQARLSMHWQPIVELATSTIIGHEGLVRTPPGCAWRSPDLLFAAARREGCTLELEHACLRLALAACGQAGIGRLFVNLSAEALAALAEEALPQPCPRHEGLPLAGVVIELTEHERVHDLAPVQQALARWRAAGATLALDDFGDGRSSLRLWSELRPEWVKIDKYFVRDVQRSSDKLKTIRALQQLADTFGSQLIAEGVEHPDELLVLRDLGLPYAQGYLFGRPQAALADALPDAVQRTLQARHIVVLPQDRHIANRGLTAQSLLIEAPALPQTASHAQVAELFHLHPDLESVALLDDQQRPVGLIARHTLQELSLNQLYFRELYGRRPALIHANTQPLCVEVHTPIEQLTQVLTSPDQRYLREGFILTENGRYRGLGTSEQLVRRVTEARIEAARHANPLTALPGNVPLTMHIERLLDHGEPFIACYADLNHFKAFNDHYGYWRGDEMIRLLAQCLTAACDTRLDFLGHVGGDDFVLLMQSSDWQERIERAILTFNEQAKRLYDEGARAAGGIWAEDRHGVQRFHPLTTLAVGVVRVQPGTYHQAEAVASAAALAKHHAKQSAQGLYLLEPSPAASAAAAPVVAVTAAAWAATLLPVSPCQ
ncbi:MAG: EAL domain-containing protein [Tepidimonas sp.]|nr:EAL domain-containing protein [Tepidimonas sp.]